MNTASHYGLDFDRVAPDLVRRASTLQAALLCDAAGRRGALHSRVQALRPSMKVAGPAFTVEVRPGDNLMVHLALTLARPGDVIIVDGKGDMTCALVGELMVAHAKAVCLAGMVVDAASRDSNTLASGQFPLFSSGRNACGPTKGLGGSVCKPISIAGVAVLPGDLVVGDSDGVVVIPRQQVTAVLDAADAKLQAEQQRLTAIARGAFKLDWLDDALLVAGMPPSEGPMA